MTGKMADACYQSVKYKAPGCSFDLENRWQRAVERRDWLLARRSNLPLKWRISDLEGSPRMAVWLQMAEVHDSSWKAACEDAEAL